MTDVEREQRLAAIYDARDQYERLRASYERDLHAHESSMAMRDLVLESPREENTIEKEFRRGFREGVGYAVDHAWRFLDAGYPRTAVYRALQNWRNGDLLEWHQAAQDGDYSMTVAPSPMPPTKKGGD